MSIFNTVNELMQEKERLVAELEFEPAMRARERIDYLKNRVNVCYEACENLKNPEHLPVLFRLLDQWLKQPMPDKIKEELSNVLGKIKG